MFLFSQCEPFIVPGSGNFISRGTPVAEPTTRSNLESFRRRVMDQKPYSAEKARGGEIILNTPLRRAVFLGGLIGAFVLVMITMMVR
jgi:hypothetical protein